MDNIKHITYHKNVELHLQTFQMEGQLSDQKKMLNYKKVQNRFSLWDYSILIYAGQLSVNILNF